MHLDDPILDASDDIDGAEWTPWKGIRRAAPRAFALSIFLSLVTMPVAYFFPLMLTQFYLRVAFSFIATWAMLAYVERCSGTVHWACTSLAVGLVILVLISHHAVWAIHGVPSYRTTATIIGWRAWMNPFSVLMISGWPLVIGGGFSTILHHLGFGLKEFAELLNTSIH